MSERIHSRFEMMRINHEEAYSLDGACTNWAEEFFSRMRRAEIGHHHHIAGAYLLRYAQEASWREDNRRSSNGEQVNRVAGLAMVSKPSVDFSGYWQRHVQTEQGSGPFSFSINSSTFPIDHRSRLIWADPLRKRTGR